MLNDHVETVDLTIAQCEEEGADRQQLQLLSRLLRSDYISVSRHCMKID